MAALLSLVCIGTATASAEVTAIPLEGASQGVAVAADGSIWVSEQSPPEIAHLSAGGQVLAQYPVSGTPQDVALGPGGRIWATLGASGLVWFDAASAKPSAHNVPTTGCPTFAITDGHDGKMYFSAPSEGACNGGVSVIGRVLGDGAGSPTSKSGFGEAFGLAALGTKLFVPDASANVVRRVDEAGFASESTIGAPAGSSPNRIAISPGGEVWTSLFYTDQVGRFPATQNGGSMTIVPIAPGLLDQPFGIAFAPDGTAYIGSDGNSSVVRTDAAGAASSIPLPLGARPNALAVGQDGTVWITDSGSARILRYSEPAPTPAPPPSVPASPSTPSGGTGSSSSSAPASPADKTPPKATLGGARTQTLGAQVQVVVTCPAEACQAVATGAVTTRASSHKGNSRSFKLRSAKATVPAGARRILRVGLSTTVKKKVAAALAGGGSATAAIKVKVTDASGNSSPAIPFSLHLRPSKK